MNSEPSEKSGKVGSIGNLNLKKTSFNKIIPALQMSQQLLEASLRLRFFADRSFETGKEYFNSRK